MNMNGGTSTSATDPHHRAAAGYLGMGLPSMDNLTPMSPPTGNGFGVGMPVGGLLPGSAVGPELKHHADFLSRLLAATPSYPNDVGNPPPGFFSDWLRRLVSKPGPGNGNHHHHQHHGARGRTSPPRMSSPSGAPTPNSIQQPSMTFSPNGNNTECKTHSPLEPSSNHQSSGTGNSNPQPLKRRKRTRISDHHLPLPHQQHPGGKNGGGSSNVRESPESPHGSHLSHNQNSLVSSALTSNLSGSSSSSAAAVAAAASLNPFTHPLWFFPPFLPNPYLNPMNMNMGMNLPGLLPPHVPQGPGGGSSSSGSPYMGGGLPSENHLLSSFRSSEMLGHGHHRQFNSEVNLTKKESPDLSVTSKGTKRSGGGSASKKKSNSFSISRLTSPSPSSNSSGGSLTSKGSVGHNNNNYNPLHTLVGSGDGNGKTASLTLTGGGGEMMTMTPTTSSTSGRMSVKAGSGGKGASSESGSETGASSNSTSTCVDLRVSGRSWEKIGVSAPPPRSIYKPLSAFHDPAELNLGPQMQQSSPNPFTSTRTTGQCPEERDSRPLSTTYVLKNLHHIYLRVKERSTDCVTINNNLDGGGSIPLKNHSDPLPHGGSPGRKNAHPTQHLRPDFSPSNEMMMMGNDTGEDGEDKKKVIDLSESRTEAGRVKSKSSGHLKIPLLRPIKAESNYKPNGGGNKTLNSLSSSSTLSFDEDEDDERLELRPKGYKYSRTSTPISEDLKDSVETEGEVGSGCGGGSDIVNVLSETEPDDEAKSGSSEDTGKNRRSSSSTVKKYRKTSLDGLLD